MSNTPDDESVPESSNTIRPTSVSLESIHSRGSNCPPEENDSRALDLDSTGNTQENSTIHGLLHSEILEAGGICGQLFSDDVSSLELQTFELDLKFLDEYLNAREFEASIFNFQEGFTSLQETVKIPDEQSQQASSTQFDNSPFHFPEDLSVPQAEFYGLSTLEDLNEPLPTTGHNNFFPVLDRSDNALIESLIDLAENGNFPIPQESFVHDELVHDLYDGLPTFMSSPNRQSDICGSSPVVFDSDSDFRFPVVDDSTGSGASTHLENPKMPRLTLNRAESRPQTGTKEYEIANPTQTEEERGKIFLEFRQTHRSLLAFRLAKSNQQVISWEEKAVIFASDQSFPTTDAAQRRDHRDLYMAIRDCNYARHVKDVPSRLQQPIAYKKFTVGYGDEMEKSIQDLCWETLDNLIKEQMKYISDAKRNKRKFNPMTFAMRKEKVIQAFLNEKDIPKRLLEETFISQVARDPEGHSSRVRNNRRVNDKKGAQIKAGARALRSASNSLDIDDDYGGPCEVILTGKIQSPSRSKRTSTRRKSMNSPTKAGVSKSTRPRRHTGAGS